MTIAAEVLVEHVAWPGNAKGLRKHTVPTMAKFIRRRSHDPRFRALAGQLLRDAGFPTTVQAKCEVFRKYVKSVTSYAHDPVNSEYVQDPELTLCLPDAPFCAPLIDCDDALPTVESLIGAAGMEPFILLLEYGGGAQIHVMGGVKDEKGAMLEVDVTTDKPVGSKSWSKTRTVVDPFDPKMMEDGEFKGGAFIGAGKAFDGTVRTMDPAMQLVGAGLGPPFTDLQTVQNYQAAVYQAMIAADTAIQNNKTSLQPTDYQQWQGTIVSFLQWYATLQECEQSTLPSWPTQCEPYYSLLQGGWTGAYTRLAAFATQANAAQAMVATAVPGYTPPSPVLPPPPPPPPAPSPADIADQIVTGAKAIGVLLLVGVGAFTLYEVVSITSGIVKASKGLGAHESKKTKKKGKRKALRPYWSAA